MISHTSTAEVATVSNRPFPVRPLLGVKTTNTSMSVLQNSGVARCRCQCLLPARQTVERRPRHIEVQAGTWRPTRADPTQTTARTSGVPRPASSGTSHMPITGDIPHRSWRGPLRHLRSNATCPTHLRRDPHPSTPPHLLTAARQGPNVTVPPVQRKTWIHTTPPPAQTPAPSPGDGKDRHPILHQPYLT